VFLRPEKSLIGSRLFPELISSSAFFDFPPHDSESQECFYLLNERSALHGNTFRPYVLKDFWPILGDVILGDVVSELI
jgi:hypothetical protein